jgi:MYXO-CTERM domain-containing protein
MQPTRPILLLALLLALLFANASPARAEVIEANPGDDIEALMNALEPGDELVLHGGTYSQSSLFQVSIVGTAAMPIVVRAADGERPIITRPDAGQNNFNIERGEHVTFRGIEFLGGSAGVRVMAARFMTIEDCEIHESEDVALRMNDGGAEYEAVRILRNHIHDTGGTGEGMYLGCNSDGCRMFDSLIEGNYVHDTDASDVEQGDGIELKEGSYNNIIRRNVIHDTNYPCILTYSVVGNGGPNIIEENVMWGCGDMGIQTAADAIIRNNIILSAAAHGIGCQPHQAGTPSNLVIVNNTVLDADGGALRVTGVTGSIVIANNALYTNGATALILGGDLSMLTLANNVVQGGESGVPSGGTMPGTLATDFVAASFSGTVPNDVFPTTTGVLAGTGSMAHLPPLDFNGTARTTADVGAYQVSASNPGWTLAPGFHIRTTLPGTDAGMNADAGVIPGTDGGPGSDGGGTGSDTGPRADAGTEPPAEGGCSCRVGHRPASHAIGVLALLALALIRRRQR